MENLELTLDRHPENQYETWLFLSRGRGRSKLPIVRWMHGTISAHPYHSANDVSISNNAQLLKQEGSEDLYVFVYQVQSQRSQTDTSTRCFRIRDPEIVDPPIDEIQEEIPESMTVIASI